MARFVALTSNKSKFTATILCLFGLATLLVFPLFGGLHRLYVGKIVSGLIYTVTGGLFGIGLVLDLLTIVMGQFTDNVGAPLRE